MCNAQRCLCAIKDNILPLSYVTIRTIYMSFDDGCHVTTSCPGVSHLTAPGGGKMRDPGNEVGHVTDTAVEYLVQNV